MIVNGTELESVPSRDLRDVPEGSVVAVVIRIRSEAAGSACESYCARNSAKSDVRYASQRRCKRQFHGRCDIRRILTVHQPDGVTQNGTVRIRVPWLDQERRAERNRCAYGVVVPRRVC